MGLPTYNTLQISSSNREDSAPNGRSAISRTGNVSVSHDTAQQNQMDGIIIRYQDLLQGPLRRALERGDIPMGFEWLRDLCPAVTVVPFADVGSLNSLPAQGSEGTTSTSSTENGKQFPGESHHEQKDPV